MGPRALCGFAQRRAREGSKWERPGRSEPEARVGVEPRSRAGQRAKARAVGIVEKPWRRAPRPSLTPGSQPHRSASHLPIPGGPRAFHQHADDRLLTLAAGAPVCADEAVRTETEEGPVAVEALAARSAVLLAHTLVHICGQMSRWCLPVSPPGRARCRETLRPTPSPAGET